MSNRKPVVLFVDDEALVLSAIRRMLWPHRKCWDVKFAEGGQVAIEMLARNRIDVVVSDMRMPAVDGEKLLDHVSTRYPEIVRIVLSGQAEKKKILNVVATAHQFLTKPCETELLTKTIDGSLRMLAEIRDEQVRRSISKMGALDSVPANTTNVSSMFADKNISVHDVCRAISCDVAMTAKIMQLVSTSFFGTPAEEANSLQTACECLGLELMQELVEDTDAFGSTTSNGEVQRQIRAINARSVAIASFASTVANLEDTDLATSAHVAGMLHDIGALVMLQNWPDEYLTILNNGFRGTQLIEAERQAFGVTHQDVGGHLLHLWGIHRDIVTSAEFHHCPQDSEHSSFSTLAAVYVADQFLNSNRDEKRFKQTMSDSVFVRRIGCQNRVDAWFETLNLAGREPLTMCNFH